MDVNVAVVTVGVHVAVVLDVQVFERILYIWAIRHPASGYVQGINDLVTPFFVIFLSEYLADGQSAWHCRLLRVSPDISRMSWLLMSLFAVTNHMPSTVEHYQLSERPVWAPGHNVPLIHLMILALHISFACLLGFPRLLPFFLYFFFENWPAPFPGQRS